MPYPYNIIFGRDAALPKECQLNVKRGHRLLFGDRV